ncbi:MAG: hypothetical protein RBS40_13510 [Rhodocyclaceae bacterium]|jgi:hypothetical protein|nr:hypothetical protein [Rhodocyclaceae bacterium]
MQPPDDGGNLWQWLVGIASTVAAAIAGWAAAARSNQRDIEARLAVVERCQAKRTEFCDSQREDIMDDLRKEVGGIVRAAIQDMVITHLRDLANLDKILAVQAETMRQIQEDVEAIFGRLNRRGDDQPLARLTPYRRRKDDVE